MTELIADTETTEAAAERAAYESLDDSERKLIQSAHRRSLEAADRILVTLHDVTASMPPSPDGSQARLVGTEHRAKEPHSIARTFVDATSFEDQDLEGLLSSMKDLVRFSVEVPEAAYGRTVAALLRSLAGRGHTAQRLLSFWGAGGRHNGLNVTMSDPTGKIYEIQFPTPLTHALGKLTHALYTRVRSEQFSPRERTEALLYIFGLNKEHGLADHQPEDLEALRTVLDSVDVSDTSLPTWIRKQRRLWELYLAELSAEGRTLDEILTVHRLTRADLLGETTDREGM